jgi:hypothetical protein
MRPRHKIAGTSGKKRELNEALRQTLELEVVKLAVEFLARPPENKCQGIAREPALSQTKEETIAITRVGTTKAPATPMNRKTTTD